MRRKLLIFLIFIRNGGLKHLVLSEPIFFVMIMSIILAYFFISKSNLTGIIATGLCASIITLIYCNRKLMNKERAHSAQVNNLWASSKQQATPELLKPSEKPGSDQKTLLRASSNSDSDEELLLRPSNSND